MRFSRRRFLVRSAQGIAAAGVAGGFYAWRIEPRWLEVVTRLLPLRHLGPDLEGRTLALITDLHIGPLVDDDYIAGVFARVTALQPDYVAFVGDFVTYEGQAIFDRLGHLLANAPRGRLGSVATLGNHDYGAGWAQSDVADRIAAIVARAGITVLRNETLSVGGLQIVGLDDLWATRFDLARALTGFDSRRPSLALSHNPDTVDRNGWSPFDSWILAGHTHGGQCKPPFLPPPLLPVQNRRYTSGEFTLTGGRKLYISRGVGHLTRVRFNVRPEVTLFRLVAA